MIITKTNIIVFLVGVFLGLCTGFFTTKAIYDQPLEESVKTDTITIHDTIPDLNPTPKDSARIKLVTRWLPAKPGTHHVADVGKMMDSIYQLIGGNNMMPDTVAVQVPITSKHFSGKNYDAYVSGFEPNLDSIRVYADTKVVTNTITKTIKEHKHFFLDAGAGCEYKFSDKSVVPFAELGLSFKSGRFGIGAYGGYLHDINENKGLPYGKVKISYDIISF